MDDQDFISADSHVTETAKVWEGILPDEQLPKRTSDVPQRGEDPTHRLDEMRQDGVMAEVLYPTHGLNIYALEDVELHEAGCQTYNRWLTEYCSVDPGRLLGVAMIPCYRPEVAIEELRWAKEAGLRGAMVWQTPHPDLPFTSMHYDPIWKVAEELDLPINVHILTGFNYSRKRTEVAPRDLRLYRINRYHGAVNEKLACTADTLFAFIFGGVLERFPGLRLVIVENEISWLPFYLDQWDYYYRRFLAADPTEMTKAPSEYFNEQVYLTFFRDPWVGRMLSSWGKHNMMWSNDFPHINSTWPNSHEYAAEQLKDVDAETADRVLRQNCRELYHISTDLAASGADGRVG